MAKLYFSIKEKILRRKALITVLGIFLLSVILLRVIFGYWSLMAYFLLMANILAVFCYKNDANIPYLGPIFRKIRPKIRAKVEELASSLPFSKGGEEGFCKISPARIATQSVAGGPNPSFSKRGNKVWFVLTPQEKSAIMRMAEIIQAEKKILFQAFCAYEAKNCRIFVDLFRRPSVGKILPAMKELRDRLRLLLPVASALFRLAKAKLAMHWFTGKKMGQSIFSSLWKSSSTVLSSTLRLRPEGSSLPKGEEGRDFVKSPLTPLFQRGGIDAVLFFKEGLRALSSTEGRKAISAFFRSRFGKEGRRRIIVSTKLHFWKLCLKVADYFTILLNKSNESFEIITDERFPLQFSVKQGGEMLEYELKTKSETELDKYLALHQAKRKRLAFFSLFGSGAMIVATIAVSLTISFIFPHIFSADAMTYNYLQIDWNTADTTATSTHTSDREGWTKYQSIDSATASSSIMLSPTNYTFTDDGSVTTGGGPLTTGGGFATGTVSNTVIQGGSTVTAGYITLATSTQVAKNDWSRGMEPVPGVLTTGSNMIRNGSDDTIYVSQGGGTGFYSYSISGNTWTALTVAPGSIGQGGVMIRNSSDDTIYVTRGGATAFWSYSISGNTWTVLTVAPGSISLGGAMIRNGSDNTIYVAQGGTTAFWSYSISGNTWTVLTVAPGAIYIGSAMIRNSSDDTIYVTQGNNNTGFYSYSISGNTWTVLTVAPGTIYYGGDMIRNSSDDTIYITQGNSQTAFWSYSISGNTWTVLTVAPGTIYLGSDMIRNSSDDTIYVTQGNATGFYSYSISGNTWTVLTVAPGTIAAGSAMIRNSSDNTIYVTQGGSTTGWLSYSISGNTWSGSAVSTLAPAPGTISTGSKMIRNSSDDTIYVTQGGATGFYSYSISGNTWTVLTVAPGSTAAGSNMLRNGSDDTIYVTRGGFTAFWSYSISGNTWTVLTVAPGTIYATGSAMLRNGSDDTIYVTQGSATAFWSYSISGNTWTVLTVAPGTIYTGGNMLRNGSDDTIYVTRGNSQTAFWSYSISGNTWTVLTVAPGNIGTGSKMIRNSSDDTIYVTRGGSTTAFWSYSISANTWTVLSANPVGFNDSSNMIRNGSDDEIYILNGTGTGLWKFVINSIVYQSSGTFISATIGGMIPSSISWTTSTPSSAIGAYALMFQVAANNDNSTWSYVGPDGTANTYFTSASTSLPASVASGNRYFKYKAYLATSSTSYTPTLNDVIINYSQYAATGTMISNPFDAEQSANIVSGLAWTESLPTGTDVKFQIRTSADGATWTDWMGPTDANDYYSASTTASGINASHKDAASDRYIQYKALLNSLTGIYTPAVSDLTLTYVVNDAPTFQSAPTSSQRTSDGYIEGGYSIRDTDTAASGVGCPLCVDNLVFEFSNNGGSSWTTITSGLSTNATSSKTVGTSSYTNYQFTWNPKIQADDTATTTMKIRITIDDLEAGNNEATSSTAAFTLDTKDPAVGSAPIAVMATSTPAGVALSATDDSALEMCITLDGTESNCATYNATSTIELATNPDTVYVIYRDAYKNATAAYSATTPETPTLLYIKDISYIAAADYREFIAWKIVNLPFNNYKVLRSTDATDYSVLTKISDRATNYYVDTGLTASTTYYYKVITEDGSGDTSPDSAVLNDKADGQGGSDITAPTISAVTVSTTTPQSATIVWDTDELSDSTVAYSTTAGSFSASQGSVTMRDTATSAGQHTITLTDLTPATTYYFRAASADISGNTVYDSNGGDGYTFTTLTGPVISDVSASNVNNTAATVIWNTDTAANSYVTYSTSSVFTYSLEAGANDSATVHSVALPNLTAGTAYYYYVESGIGKDTNGGNYYSFTTSNDTTAPTISGISTAMRTDTKATIEWTTSEKANSAVWVGSSSGSYSATSTINADLGTLHDLIVSGLTAKTAYYYIVVSGDANGNFTTSSEQTFTTLQTLSEESAVVARVEAAAAAGSGPSKTFGDTVADKTPPIIKNTTADKITSSTARVKWETDEIADSFVEYGPNSGGYTERVGDFKLGIEHFIALKKLLPQTKYYYRVISADGSGNRTTGDEKTFTTLTVEGAVKAAEKAGKEVAAVGEEAGKADDKSIFEAAFNKMMSVLGQFSSQLAISSWSSVKASATDELLKLTPVLVLAGEPKVEVTDTEANIIWQTNEPANSLVRFARADAYDASAGDSGYAQEVGNSDTMVKTHRVTLRDLLPSTFYHYQVRSKDDLGAEAKSRDFTFQTTVENLDITSYVFEVISNEKASFSWVTNVETDSQIKYIPYRNGVLAVDEAKIKFDKSVTTIHALTVDDFESGIVYDIELSGRDVEGNTIARKISSFSTSQQDFPPEISNVQTNSALSPGEDVKVQTIISWTTNEPASGAVYYQKGVGAVNEDAWSKTQPDPSYVKKHVAVVTKFDPGSIYKFKIEVEDSTGNTSYSKIFTVLSPRQKETVFQIILKNFEKTFSWTQKIKL